MGTENRRWDWACGRNTSMRESGVYEACATVTSPACPEGTTWCMEVAVDACPDVECELDIVVEWTDPEADGPWPIADGAPEWAVVEWFNEDGDLIATGEVADLVDVGGEICATYETPECPEGVEARVELEPWSRRSSIVNWASRLSKKPMEVGP